MSYSKTTVESFKIAEHEIRIQALLDYDRQNNYALEVETLVFGDLVNSSLLPLTQDQMEALKEFLRMLQNHNALLDNTKEYDDDTDEMLSDHEDRIEVLEQKVKGLTSWHDFWAKLTPKPQPTTVPIHEWIRETTCDHETTCYSHNDPSPNLPNC